MLELGYLFFYIISHFLMGTIITMHEQVLWYIICFRLKFTENLSLLFNAFASILSEI